VDRETGLCPGINHEDDRFGRVTAYLVLTLRWNASPHALLRIVLCGFSRPQISKDTDYSCMDFKIIGLSILFIKSIDTTPD
jgi:hypothetical protein